MYVKHLVLEALRLLKAEYVSESKFFASRVLFATARSFVSEEHAVDVVSLHHVLDGVLGPDFCCASLIRYLRYVVLVDQVGHIIVLLE